MNSNSRTLFLILYIAGLALLCFGFLLLVPEAHRSHVAWLDFIVVAAVFSTVFLGAFALKGGIAEFAGTIPRLAVFLWASPLYAAAALGVLWYGLANAVPFRPQLVIQLGLAFLLAITAVFALMGSEQVQNVAEAESLKGQSLKSLKDALAECEAALFGPGLESGALRTRFDRLKEDVRFLSPVEAGQARGLECDLARAVDAIRSTAALHDQTRVNEEVPQLLERCESLVALRRNCRIEYGEKG